MDQRLSFVTLAVRDLDAARRFYLDGLGWQAELDVPGEVVMIRVADKVVLSLWNEAAFTEEIGRAPSRDSAAPLTLSHNVATRAEVGAVLQSAAAAGAAKVRPAQERAWGGYTGYFADPDGFLWEVAWNPGEIGASVLP